jgi:hypothetical protein
MGKMSRSALASGAVVGYNSPKPLLADQRPAFAQDRSGRAGRTLSRLLLHRVGKEREPMLETVWNFVTDWPFMIIMAVILVILIAVFFIVRSRKQE